MSRTGHAHGSGMLAPESHVPPAAPTPLSGTQSCLVRSNTPPGVSSPRCRVSANQRRYTSPATVPHTAHSHSGRREGGGGWLARIKRAQRPGARRRMPSMHSTQHAAHHTARPTAQHAAQHTFPSAKRQGPHHAAAAKSADITAQQSTAQHSTAQHGKAQHVTAQAPEPARRRRLRRPRMTDLAGNSIETKYCMRRRAQRGAACIVVQ